MKTASIVLAIIISICVGGFCAWTIRGKYDAVYILEGRFHVVSNMKQDHDVALNFPSGTQIQFHLKQGRSFDFMLHNTGEGAVAVSIDGKVREHVGYVTSYNSMAVLVINDEKTDFSHISP